MKFFNPLDIIHPTVFFLALYSFYFGFSLLFYFLDFLPFHVQAETVLLVILYPFIFVLFAQFVAPLLFGGKIRKKRNVCDVVESFSARDLIFLSTGSAAIITLLSIHFFNGYIPIFEDDLETLRISAISGKGFLVVPSIAVLTLAAGWGFARSRFRNAFRYKIFFFVSFLVVFSFGFRAPAFYILLLGLVFSYSLSPKYAALDRIPYSWIFFAPVFLIFIIILGLYRANSEGLVLSQLELSGLYYVLSVNLLNFNEIVLAFNSDNFMWGMSFINDFLVLVPGTESSFLGTYLKDQLNLTFSGSSISATAPGEGYVNFGFIGTCGHAAIAGLFAGVVYQILCRDTRLPYRFLLVVFSVTYARIVTGGFSAIFFFSLGPLVILWFIFYKNRFRYG